MSVQSGKNKSIGYKYVCKNCEETYECSMCEDEKSTRFKHRTHCYTGQLGIDRSCIEYHYCNECFDDMNHGYRDRELCPFCWGTNCECGSKY